MIQPINNISFKSKISFIMPKYPKLTESQEKTFKITPIKIQ